MPLASVAESADVAGLRRVPSLYGRRSEDNLGYRKGIGAYNGGPSNPNMPYAKEVIERKGTSRK